MALFEDHLAYAEPQIRPILQELRVRILVLGSRVQEKATPAQRIAYSVARVFAEVKVQKKRVLVRVFDMGITDPRAIISDIPAKYKWQHQKEIAIDNLTKAEQLSRTSIFPPIILMRVPAPQVRRSWR